MTDITASVDQVAKVIGQKAVSPPHTHGSVVFAMWRQLHPV